MNGQCPSVTQINYSNYTGTSVAINWTPGGTETSWNIEYGIHPYNPATNSGVIVSAAGSTTFFAFGLLPNTAYDFYISANCNNQGLSAQTGPVTVPNNSISGTLTYDIDTNGCDNLDPIANGVRINAVSSSNSSLFSAITDSNGNYEIFVPNDSYVLEVDVNSSFVSVNPLSTIVTFPNSLASSVQNFCIAPLTYQQDIDVSIVPLSQARPGFDVGYEIIVVNRGTLAVTDALNFSYPSDVMSFLTAIPLPNNTTVNSLSWNYSLQPFESIIYELSFNLNPPTHPIFPLNSNDILNLNAATYLTGGDVNLTNNTFNLNQTLVNSYDPNDKTCLQGNTIQTDMIGEYLHYLIRFENTGTASAINVKVKDVIDTSRFDIGSFVPLASSHEYYTRVTNGNEVSFHFDNINLDYNNASNDGYVMFKIKTLYTLVEGNSFDNTAGIYFDFNFPIITNTETVSILNTASIDYLTDNSIVIFPNPSKDFINLKYSNSINDLKIFNIQGKIQSQYERLTTNFNEPISIKNLKQGVYFIVVKSDRGQNTLKFIKN
jgi:hypothetical protein